MSLAPGWRNRIGMALAKVQSPARLRHSLAVARWAAELATRHGANPAAAETAGLLHDWAKEWPPRRLLGYVRRHRLPLPGPRGFFDQNPNLLHGLVSAHWVAARGWVCDPRILAAMARHTLGHRGMSLLDHILYVADFSSPDRRYSQAARVRQLARRDLSGALRVVVAFKMGEVIRRGRALHPSTVDLWNELCRKPA